MSDPDKMRSGAIVLGSENNSRALSQDLRRVQSSRITVLSYNRDISRETRSRFRVVFPRPLRGVVAVKAVDVCINRSQPLIAPGFNTLTMTVGSSSSRVVLFASGVWKGTGGTTALLQELGTGLGSKYIVTSVGITRTDGANFTISAPPLLTRVLGLVALDSKTYGLSPDLNLEATAFLHVNNWGSFLPAGSLTNAVYSEAAGSRDCFAMVPLPAKSLCEHVTPLGAVEFSSPLTAVSYLNVVLANADGSEHLVQNDWNFTIEVFCLP